MSAFISDGTRNGCVEIVDFKASQNAITIRPIGRIADPTMMMFHLETVQLEN